MFLWKAYSDLFIYLFFKQLMNKYYNWAKKKIRLKKECNLHTQFAEPAALSFFMALLSKHQKTGTSEPNDYICGMKNIYYFIFGWNFPLNSAASKADPDKTPCPHRHKDVALPLKRNYDAHHQKAHPQPGLLLLIRQSCISKMEWNEHFNAAVK